MENSGKHCSGRLWKNPLFHSNKGTLPTQPKRPCTSDSMQPLQTNRVVVPHYLEFLCRAAEKYSNVFPNLSSSVSEEKC